MLEKLEGIVASYKEVSTRRVQFELEGVRKVIELTVSEPWVINRGDEIVVAGEEDEKTGKFIGYAYKNVTRGVFGKYDPGVVGGYVFVIAGLFFCWAIFPLFTHVPAGFRVIALGKKVSQATSSL
jgi:hypothetical protein